MWNTSSYPVMRFYYQCIMDYPCPLSRYLDVALVAINTQDAAALE